MIDWMNKESTYVPFFRFVSRPRTERYGREALAEAFLVSQDITNSDMGREWEDVTS
jgi:hypothetical protein